MVQPQSKMDSNQKNSNIWPTSRHEPSSETQKNEELVKPSVPTSITPSSPKQIDDLPVPSPLMANEDSNGIKKLIKQIIH
jgi:hypothetical protein